jgi:vitamin B12 transporter
MVGYTGPLFLSSTWNEFQVDARHDRYSDFGDATTGLAAYGLKFAPGWKAIVQASNAFKAPTFDELFYPYFGNPDLRAERARTFEVGIQFTGGATLARLSAFTTHTSNLIVFDPNLQLANNIARARVRGTELTGRTVIDGWQLTANLTYAEPVDADTGQRLLRRASRNGDLAVAKSFGHWRFAGDVQAAGPRFDSDILTFARTEVAGYSVVNLGLRYQLVKGTTVGVGVTNALDRRYALVDGYNTAGRVSLLTVEAKY